MSYEEMAHVSTHIHRVDAGTIGARGRRITLRFLGATGSRQSGSARRASKETAMIKTRNLAALLALSSVAVLPACSWFDGGSRSSRVGSPTRSYAATPNYNATPQAQTTELTPDMIRNVQQTLQQDGSYHGRVDGVWGPSTQAAV